MKDVVKKIFVVMLLFLPVSVLASSGTSDMGLPAVLLIEAFITIHSSAFFLYPLASVVTKEGSIWPTFWKFFGIRIAILLFFDIFISTAILGFDVAAIFIGAFIFLPMSIKNKKLPDNFVIENNTNMENSMDIEEGIPCSYCRSIFASNEEKCPYCGAPREENSSDRVVVLSSPSKFDEMYRLSEEKLLETFLKKEISACGIDVNTKLIPENVLKRRKVFQSIFSILLCAFIVMIFFHFPLSTYGIGVIILFILYKLSKNYNLIKYLKKEVKSRPKEKITNIVMNVKNSLVKDTTTLPFCVKIAAAIILPLFVFIKPMIFYEPVAGGYAVRFYTFGLTNFKTATIPEMHNGKPVIALRGNTFSNMPFLETVTLPDTITEIRGQAFKNDGNLKNVNIPKNLTYLGGGAFYNCSSITSIELPDTLTYMGGEVFYGASSLQSVKLSENLTEIRGDSFEYCTSLTSIDIPDKVTRIGGHAFYGDTSLEEVNISRRSALQEIGSSAFRLCTNLKVIIIPERTTVNSRAFKESPTIVYRFVEGFTNSKGPVSMSLNVGEKRIIYTYRDNSNNVVNNMEIELVSIEDGKYTFLYTQTTSSYLDKKFVLTKENNHKLVIGMFDFYLEKSDSNRANITIYFR